jgi:hypothetical protein
MNEATYHPKTMPSQLNDLKRARRFRPPLRSDRILSPEALRARKKFLRHFPDGFGDATYLERVRGDTEAAYERWCATLRRSTLSSLISAGDYRSVADRAASIASGTTLLFSTEKAALRDALGTPQGARLFATALCELLHGKGSDEHRFAQWVDVIARLARRQTRVLTWPLVTAFGFIAQPDRHVFLKPVITRRAAQAYGYPFEYAPEPNWRTYVSLMEFAGQVRDDHCDLGPRDMIDLQSFIWVQGSDEYD